MTENSLNEVGVRKVPTAIVSVVAATTSTTLYQITSARTRFARLKKLMIANRNAANAQIRIGTGNFTQVMPDILVIAGNDLRLTEEELAGFVFTSDIVVQSSVGAASPNDIQLLPEVEEVG